MRRRQRTLSEFLVRALAVAGLVYAGVATYAVPATLLSAETGRADVVDRDQSPGQVVTLRWTPAHARRFPDCRDMASWEGPTVPATVVVVTRAGSPRPMSFTEAYQRARSASRADDVWTIGACR